MSEKVLDTEQVLDTGETDDLVRLNVSFETPTDLEYEDYVNRINTTFGDFKDIRFNLLERRCDGCHKPVPYRQQGLSFKCKACGLHYDLCADCQQDFELAKCPVGWGCGFQGDRA